MPADNAIQIRFVKSARVEDVVALYKEAGWWNDEFNDSLSWVPSVIEKSFLFAGAFDGERMVGMSRALSDGVSDAYIVDVAVLKEYRGQKIAKRLVDSLVEELTRLEIDWIVAISVPGTLDFYKKLGAEVMEGYTPIRFGRKGAHG